MPPNARDVGEGYATLRRLVDHLPTMVGLADAEGRTVQANAKLRDFLGASQERLAGEAWFRVVHPDDRAALRREGLRARDDGVAFSTTVRVGHGAGGTYRWCRLRAALLPGFAAPAVWWCVLEDVHAQHAAREQQAALARLGRLALQGTELPDLMDAAVKLVSQTLDMELCKVLELLPGGGELLLRAGVGWDHGLVGQASVPTDTGSQAGYTLVMDGPVVVEDLPHETRFRGPELLARHGVLGGLSVTIDTPEGPYGVLGVHTRRRRSYTPEEMHFVQAVGNVLGEAVRQHGAQAALRERSRQLQAVADHAPALIARFDRQFRHLFVNRAITEATGIPAESYLGRTNDELGLPPDLVESWHAALRDVFATGRAQRGEFAFDGGGGPRHYVSVVAPETDESGGVVAAVSVVQDVTEVVEAERTSREAQERSQLLESVVVHTHDGVLILEADPGASALRVVYANPAFLELTGYAEEEVRGASVRMLIGPKTDDGTLDRIRVALAAGRPARGELVLYGRDGRECATELGVAPVTTEGEEAHQFVAVLRDVTERKRQEDRLRTFRDFRSRLSSLTQELLSRALDESVYERVLDAAVEVVPEVQAASLMLLDDDLQARFVAVRGYDDALLDVVLGPDENDVDHTNPDPQVLRGFRPPARMDPRKREIMYGDVGRAREIRSTLRIPVWLEGRPRAQFNLDNFQSEDAFGEDAIEMARLFGRHIATIMQRFAFEESLHRQAYHDPLTGLPNRRYAQEHLEEVLHRAVSSGERGALLFLDVDDFKHINDAYGHALGDALLVRLARRLEDGLGGDEVLMRWSGDEFMLVRPGMGSMAGAADAARTIVDRLAKPFRVDGTTLFVGSSVGVALYPRDGEDVERLVRHADIALHQAKRRGKKTFAVFTPDMSDAVTRRIRLEGELRAALDAGALRVHFQPRVELRTGRVTAVEALARWRHPELGAIEPREFIRVAEESGLIHPLGAWVLDEGCRRAREWLDARTPRVVAVNISMRQLRRSDFVDQVRAALQRHGLDGRWLELEITESVAMTDVADTVDKLSHVRDLGTSVSIDDFGTAYSSLAHLRQLPIDTLKIDASFVRDLGDDPTHDPGGASIIQAIIALGKGLNLRVVAEGVETEGQRSFLQILGCDEAQGHLFEPLVSDGD